MLTELEGKLVDKIKEVGLQRRTAHILVHYLTEPTQQQKMIDYLEKYRDIITDHQAIQHADKILQGRR